MALTLVLCSVIAQLAAGRPRSHCASLKPSTPGAKRNQRASDCPLQRSSWKRNIQLGNRLTSTVWFIFTPLDMKMNEWMMSGRARAYLGVCSDWLDTPYSKICVSIMTK